MPDLNSKTVMAIVGWLATLYRMHACNKLIWGNYGLSSHRGRTNAALKLMASSFHKSSLDAQIKLDKIVFFFVRFDLNLVWNYRRKCKKTSRGTRETDSQRLIFVINHNFNIVWLNTIFIHFVYSVATSFILPENFQHGICLWPSERLLLQT